MSYWVIGGTSGIGQATAGILGRAGHRVYSTGVERDVRDADVLAEQLSYVEAGLGPLEGVVYSAGINRLEWLGEMYKAGLQDARDVLDTNLLGFINLMDVLATNVRKRNCPIRVVAVSSDAATRPMRTSMAYCASKAGLDMAVRVAARELGPLGWRINAVSPGMTAPTGISRYIDETVPKLRGWTEGQAMEYELSQSVIRRRITTAEVANVIVDTLNGPDMLNGSIITVNGGR